MLMESPIMRQFNFPGIFFDAGPDLQIRSAGIIDGRSFVFTNVPEIIFTEAHNINNPENFIWHSVQISH